MVLVLQFCNVLPINGLVLEFCPLGGKCLALWENGYKYNKNTLQRPVVRASRQILRNAFRYCLLYLIFAPLKNTYTSIFLP